MKHIKLFNNETNYNTWLTSDNFVTPYVSKIKSNGNINYQKRLPYDKEIEYLESSGVQYITLDYIPQGNDIEIGGEFMLLGYLNNASWCGLFSTYVNEQTNTYRLIRSSNRPMTLYAHNNTRAQGGGVDIDIYLNTKYNFVFTYDTLTIGDMSYNNKKIHGNENTAPMILFGSTTCCRFYSFYIKKNNKLVLDLIPVRDNNNIGYMYDKINGKLYCSDSTNFILGQDK